MRTRIKSITGMITLLLAALAPALVSAASAQSPGTALCEAQPTANVAREQASLWVQQVEAALPSLGPALDRFGTERAAALLAAHRRVRSSAGLRVRDQRVEVKLPLDLLGIYVLMPAPAAR